MILMNACKELREIYTHDTGIVEKNCTDTVCSALLQDLCPNATTTLGAQCTSPTTSIYTSCPSQSSSLLSIVATTIIVAASPTTCVQPPGLSTVSNVRTNANNMNGQSPSKTAVSSNSMTTAVIGLGALLGLSLVLLAVVITGWVCTCLIAKKRNR